MTSTPQVPTHLATPSENRGVAFTDEERAKYVLTGRLPSAVQTLEQQAARVWTQLQSLPTDLARNLLMDQLHNRNEALFQGALRAPHRAHAGGLHPHRG